LLFGQLYLYLVIDAKIKAQPVVQLPAELVILNRRNNAQQPGILEELPRQIIDI
jgi:septum formation topological specificity factor MinE